MNAYSSELREHIARVYDEGAGSQRALAARFHVSRSFVERLLRRRSIALEM
jgi:transposase